MKSRPNPKQLTAAVGKFISHVQAAIVAHDFLSHPVKSEGATAKYETVAATSFVACNT